jgi:hypothetical protein
VANIDGELEIEWYARGGQYLWHPDLALDPDQVLSQGWRVRDFLGCVLVDNEIATLGWRSDLSLIESRALLEAAVVRVRRFRESGPEPDGWQRRSSDGMHQLWLRQIEMPEL